MDQGYFPTGCIHNNDNGDQVDGDDNDNDDQGDVDGDDNGDHVDGDGDENGDHGDDDRHIYDTLQIQPMPMLKLLNFCSLICHEYDNDL